MVGEADQDEEDDSHVREEFPGVRGHPRHWRACCSDMPFKWLLTPISASSAHLAKKEATRSHSLVAWQLMREMGHLGRKIIVISH